MGEPLLVEVTRGTTVESRHDVDLVVSDATGTVLDAWGDPDRRVLARSALKPIQATPLVTTGTAHATGLGSEELAIASASHSGEPQHVAVVTAWLERQGHRTHHLECGAHRPGSLDVADDIVRSGLQPTAVHNNCSGKHAGFLATCAHLDLDPSGYIRPDHPLQRDHITAAIEDLCRTSFSSVEPGVDGCGIPVWPLTLRQLATGWGQLGRRGAGEMVLGAMANHPHLVAGTDRHCTRVMIEAAGAAVVKSGAEGVYCGIDRRNGTSFALKVRDGASRAAETAAAWVLDRWGAIDHAGPRPLTNWAGREVGEVRIRER